MIDVTYTIKILVLIPAKVAMGQTKETASSALKTLTATTVVHAFANLVGPMSSAICMKVLVIQDVMDAMDLATNIAICVK